MKNNVSLGSEPKLRLPFILSVVLHLAIIGAVMVASPVSSYRLDATNPQDQPVVKAAVVDSSQLAAQVQAIKLRESQQQAEQQQKLQQLKAQAVAARQAKAAEEQRLAQIKVDQQKTLQQQQLVAQQVKAEQQRLLQLKIQQKQQQEAQAQALALKKQQQAAQAKALAEKKQRDLAAAAAAKQKQAELAAQENALQQQLTQQQITSDQQQLAQVQQMQGLVDQYRARILTAIAKQWLIPEGAEPSISCVFTLDVTPAGVVTHAQLIHSSGNAALDRAAETAIYKASPLPVPKDPLVFAPFRHFTLKMTPQDIAR